MKKRTTHNQCPCGSDLSLEDCCQPFISRTASAPTAEALMRSRYTAYCLGNIEYLLSSWHPSTRPEKLDLEDDKTQWIRLKIIDSTNNSVEFIATYRLKGKAHKLHETSRFIFENSNWFYVDGDSHAT